MKYIKIIVNTESIDFLDKKLKTPLGEPLPETKDNKIEKTTSLKLF